MASLVLTDSTQLTYDSQHLEPSAVSQHQRSHGATVGLIIQTLGTIGIIFLKGKINKVHVGSLSACYFAKRGHQVDLFEYRDDIRLSEHVRGRTINLTMSSRARAALRKVGLEEVFVNQHGIPLEGRMIHGTNCTRRISPYDPRSKQCIYSVCRNYLNEILLTATEKYKNVTLHFNHKLVSADLERGKLNFQRSTGHGTSQPEMVSKASDLVVGADGAFSTVRMLLMKRPGFDYSQRYIEHGYLELCIPPTEDGEFAMEQNYLHIWPRGTFMMIALPNQDRSWTVTLFMPLKQFRDLDTEAALLYFFGVHFPDAIPLIGEGKLVADFFAGRPCSLVSIKCHPYHVGDKAVIIGDAAHAMGFEDCLILDQLMDIHGDDLSVVLREFSQIRNEDAEAICDLAMYNYIEMRDLVNRRSYYIRKKLDELLFQLFPNLWMPLYPSVTFTNMSYRSCQANKHWQDQVRRVVVCTDLRNTLYVLNSSAPKLPL
uniref:FAD-binding domain-containing protein n=1 Tax=Timema poppense TaxID=170557 RepID=A0A7R9DJ45_TIMPO|nr:unnamed protein product [Timema poppensis]